jgi:hypothetical protein
LSSAPDIGASLNADQAVPPDVANVDEYPVVRMCLERLPDHSDPELMPSRPRMLTAFSTISAAFTSLSADTRIVSSRIEWP